MPVMSFLTFLYHAFLTTEIQPDENLLIQYYSNISNTTRTTSRKLDLLIWPQNEDLHFHLMVSPTY